MRRIHFSVFMSLLLSTASMNAFASSMHDEQKEGFSDAATPRKRSKSTKTKQETSSATLSASIDVEKEEKTGNSRYDALLRSAEELTEKEEVINLKLEDLQKEEQKTEKELKKLKTQLAAFKEIEHSEGIGAWEKKIVEAKKQKQAIQESIEDIKGQISAIHTKAQTARGEAEKLLLDEWKTIPLLPVHYKDNAKSLTFDHVLAMMQYITLKKDWDQTVFEAADDVTAYRFSLAFDDFKLGTYIDLKNKPKTVADYYKAAHAVQGKYRVQFETSATSKEGCLEGEEVLTHHYTIRKTDDDTTIDKFFISLALKPAAQHEIEKARGNDVMPLQNRLSILQKDQTSLEKDLAAAKSDLKRALKRLATSYIVPSAWREAFESFASAKKGESVEVHAPVLTYHHLWHLVGERPFVRHGSKPSVTIATYKYNLTFKLDDMSLFEDIKPSDYIHFDQYTWSPAKTVNGEISVPHLTLHYAVYSNTRENRKKLEEQTKKSIDIVIEPIQKKKKDASKDSTLDVEKVQKSMRGEETSLRARMVALRKQTSELRLRKKLALGTQENPSGTLSPRGFETHTDSSGEDQLENSLASLVISDDQPSSSHVTSPKTPRKSSASKGGLTKKQNDPKSIPEESEDAS
ncbi:MAG: hypothetical protein ACTHJ4_07790 [Candidatus Nucleicultricaceae bacterium]